LQQYHRLDNSWGHYLELAGYSLMKKLSLLLTLLASPVLAQGGMGPGPGMVHIVVVPHTIVVSSIGGACAISSTCAISGTYTGTAPAGSGWTGAWNSPCSGSSTIAITGTPSGGNWSGTATTPSSSCTGTLTVTDNLSASATSASTGIGIYNGPGNIVSGADMYYSCTFAYTSAYANGTNKTCQLQRADNNATYDMVALTTGLSDAAGAATFCAGTTCGILKMYQQAGGSGQDVSQASKVTQATLVFNCFGTLPCVRNTGTSNSFATTMPTATQPITMLAATSRTGDYTDYQSALFAGDCDTGHNTIIGYSNSAGFAAVGHTGLDELRATAPDNQFISLMGIIHGVTSSLTVNGTTTTGSLSTLNPGNVVSTATVVGADGCVGTKFLTGDILEVGRWPSKHFTPTEITNMNTNMRARGGY
jgi:hypothetical protein